MAEFSKVTITFLIDFDIDYSVKLTTSFGGVTTSRSWDWVALRSLPFEVTTGTPTGTAGEVSASDFEAAFDLDLPTDFITTVTSNQIEIISETEGLDFVGFRGYDNDAVFLINGVDYEIAFENYVEPVDTSNIDFALVRSPHYVNIPFYFDTTTSATINLTVWDGDLATVPATSTYSLTIPRPSINFAEFNVDLAKLIQEQIETSITIDLTSDTQIVDSTNDSVKWVKYTASYNDPEEVISDIEGTFVAVDGYGLYSEGVNPTKPTTDILTSASYRKVSRDGFILFPFVNNGGITSIDVLSSNNAIDTSETITTSTLSKEVIQYLDIDVSVTTTDEYITVTTQPNGDIFTYEILDECRYEPIQVIFKNRYGVFDSITLFKKSNISISTKNDEFINNYVSGGVYNTTKHQYKKLNVTAKKTIKINSGYITQSENELYEELLNSEEVYFYQNDALLPVNVKTSSLDFKTRLNDNLVNYSLDFEYAYDIIQNV